MNAAPSTTTPSGGPPPPAGGPALEVRDLRKTYRDGDRTVQAVDDVTLTINPGEIVSLLGPNGAGKTTLLDMVLGLIPPTAGDIRACGLDPAGAIKAAKISALMQTGGLVEDMKVREIVEYIAAAYPHHEDIDAVIGRTNLTGIAGRKVAKLSGGERQRVKFALALLPDPEVLILDEPTTGMDVTIRREFWETMHEEANVGRTVIFATHYLEEAERFADRIILLGKGRVIADGTPAEIRAVAGVRRVTAMVGEADGGVVTRIADQYAGTISDGRLTVATADSDDVARALLGAGARDLEIVAPSLDDAFELIVAEAEKEA